MTRAALKHSRARPAVKRAAWEYRFLVTPRNRKSMTTTLGEAFLELVRQAAVELRLDVVGGCSPSLTNGRRSAAWLRSRAWLNGRVQTRHRMSVRSRPT